MEKKKSKVPMILIGIVCILIGGFLGLWGTTSYFYNNRFKFADAINEEIKNNDTTKTTTTIVPNKSTSEVSLSADERYHNYLTNLESNIKEKYEKYSNNVITGNSMILDTDINFTITKDLNLLFTTGDKKYNNYKLSENVLNMFLVYTGNGGYQYLYFIKNDGSLNKFCVDCLNEDKTLKVEKVNFKNIVNITQGLFDYEFSGASDPIFIDIDGNILLNN